MNFLDLTLAWSLQILLITLVAEILAPLLNTSHPRMRARFWSGALVLGLASPWFFRSVPGVSPASDDGIFIVTAAAVDQTFDSITPPWRAALLILWASVVLIRMVRLARGLHQLKAITQESEPCESASARGLRVRASASIQSPAASFFGNIVLVPRHFGALPLNWQRAALQHEEIHLERGHGQLLVFEEVILAFFWFHPAVFRLIQRVRDSREEMVDAATVEASGAPAEYREMLIGLAAQIRIPAPAVSGTTALGARIESLIALERNPMPKTSTPRLLSASLALMVTAAFASAAAPIGATAQDAPKGDKKTSDKPRRNVISKVNPDYPQDLKKQGIAGVVTVTVTIDAKGEVTNAIAGPEDHPGLAKAAIEAIQKWRWEPGDGSFNYTYHFEFRLDKGAEKK